MPHIHRRKLIQRCLDYMHITHVSPRLGGIPQRNTSKTSIFGHIGNDAARRRASHVTARRRNLRARRQRQEYLEVFIARLALGPCVPLAKVEAPVHVRVVPNPRPRAGCARRVVVELNEYCIKPGVGECCGQVRIWEHALRGCGEEVFFASVPARAVAQAKRKVLEMLRGRQLDVEVESVDDGVAERSVVGPAAAEGVPDLVGEGVCGRLALEARVRFLAAAAAADGDEDLLADLLAGFDVGAA